MPQRSTAIIDSWQPGLRQALLAPNFPAAVGRIARELHSKVFQTSAVRCSDLFELPMNHLKLSFCTRRSDQTATT